MEPGLGSDLQYDFGELIDINHISGISDAKVQIEVIDPYLLTGDQYKMYFSAH